MATLILEKPRPVRWRRRLRGACFWTAVALATIALVEELELNAAVAALAIPAAVLALRDLVRALRFRREGRLAERVSKGLRDELGDEYVVLTEYEPRDGLAEHVAIVVVGPPGIFVVEPVAGDAGVHALARELRSRAPRSDASPRYTRAVAEALTHPVPIAVAG